MGNMKCIIWKSTSSICSDAFCCYSQPLHVFIADFVKKPKHVLCKRGFVTRYILSKIYHTAIKYWMSLVGFIGTSMHLYLISPKKKAILKQNYYFQVKYENEVLKNMCELFRIRIQPMMLRALWYFHQGSFRRLSSTDLFVGGGGSSRTDSWGIKLLHPSGSLSLRMQPAVPLRNFTVMCHRNPHFCLFISECEDGLHFWSSGQWLSGTL